MMLFIFLLSCSGSSSKDSERIPPTSDANRSFINDSFVKVENREQQIKIHDAVWKHRNDDEKVLSFVEEGVDPFSLNDKGESAFSLMLKLDKFDLAEKVLDCSTDFTISMTIEGEHDPFRISFLDKSKREFAMKLLPLYKDPVYLENGLKVPFIELVKGSGESKYIKPVAAVTPFIYLVKISHLPIKNVAFGSRCRQLLAEMNFEMDSSGLENSDFFSSRLEEIMNLISLADFDSPFFSCNENDNSVLFFILSLKREDHLSNFVGIFGTSLINFNTELEKLKSKKKDVYEFWQKKEISLLLDNRCSDEVRIRKLISSRQYETIGKRKQPQTPFEIAEGIANVGKNDTVLSREEFFFGLILILNELTKNPANLRDSSKFDICSKFCDFILTKYCNQEDLFRAYLDKITLASRGSLLMRMSSTVRKRKKGRSSSVVVKEEFKAIYQILKSTQT